MSIYYRPDDYYPTSHQIYGRTNANAGLLNGIIQYSRRSSIAFYVEEEAHFRHIQRQLSFCLPLSSKQIQPIYYGDHFSLNKNDLYFTTDPILSKSAWSRAMIGASAYSLCGITHSISSLALLEEIGRLITAPIEPWDAIICTSFAVKNVIQGIFQQWYDYLKQYRHLNYQSSLQLPIIPLGIHVDETSSMKNKPALRKKFREKWSIKENDFVVLFHGRLSYYEKAHPVPMYLVLENFAKRVKQEISIYCVQAGWFKTEEEEAYYRESIKNFCPSIKSIFLLNIDNVSKLEMWSGADVFISLVDNIQESFGLTPLEAMANELPVIVSDWSGYKETVRHGIDGFRIPTILPPKGCGVDLALGYLSNAINYYTYCGLSAQMTAVDINACVEALWQLYSCKELRYEMGASGRQHVIKNFDWKEIIKQYDSLWDSLTEIRLHAQQKNGLLNSPLLSDPYLTYSIFSTHTLHPSNILNINSSSNEKIQKIQMNHLAYFGWQQRLPLPLLNATLDFMNQNGTQTVQQIIDFITKLDATMDPGIIVRSLTYLIKYDVLSISVKS